jgi:hypothetical protein
LGAVFVVEGLVGGGGGHEAIVAQAVGWPSGPSVWPAKGRHSADRATAPQRDPDSSTSKS